MRVRGNSLVPPTLFGRFAILCAFLRQLHLILQIAVFSGELARLNPSVFFVDQLSAGVPLLRLLRPSARVLFYCHFPDQLLAKKGGVLKALYRLPFDWLESWSTGCSDGILVNSRFTKGIFSETFPLLKGRDPAVVYPSVDTSSQSSDVALDDGETFWKGDRVLLSINRFERKKDVGLAIRAYAKLPEKVRMGSKLVIAGIHSWLPYQATSHLLIGGYDPRVAENLAYHKELCDLSSSLGLMHATFKAIVSALAVSSDVQVIFLLSVPNSVKAKLLSTAKLVIYTPRNEHLGIVPLEAMLAGVPVLAANEGGPTETIVEGRTGWLRDANDVDQWAAIMRDILADNVDQATLQRMGYQGRQRVKELFSKDKMASRLDEEIQKLETAPRPPILTSLTPYVVAFLVVGVVSAAMLSLNWSRKRSRRVSTI